MVGSDGRIRAELSEAQLVAWGERIGREARVPLVIALHGELGAGKSTLARAVARGAGVAGAVPSPTFNLLFVYETGRGRLRHVDLFRLERADEIWELGWDELGSGPELVLIEWASRAGELLPVPRWDVTLEETLDPRTRAVTAEPTGKPAALPPPVEER